MVQLVWSSSVRNSAVRREVRSFTCQLQDIFKLVVVVVVVLSLQTRFKPKEQCRLILIGFECQNILTLQQLGD